MAKKIKKKKKKAYIYRSFYSRLPRLLSRSRCVRLSGLLRKPLVQLEAVFTTGALPYPRARHTWPLQVSSGVRSPGWSKGGSFGVFLQEVKEIQCL